MRFLLIAVAALGLAGCSSLAPSWPEPATSPSAEVPWIPPPGAAQPASPPKTAEIPEELRAHASELTLTQVVDVALRNSPFTREAWWRARAAAAEVAIRHATLAPEIDVEADLRRTRQAGQGGETVFQQTTWGPAATINYLLFDFGGRQADVESARQSLYAAGFAHNQAIQDVVLSVERAYYQYQGTKALLEAERANLRDVQTNLQAADERRRAGVATVTDVLQSRTAVAQAQLNIESLEGQLLAVRGSLAAAMGLPANLPYDVGPLPAEIQPRQTGEAVEELIARALGERPDLLAARADVQAAASDVASLRADLLPRLFLQGTVSRQAFGSSVGSANNLYSGTLTLSYPLFDGGGRRARVRQAEADRETARSRAEGLEQAAITQVWTDYAAVRTAAQRIETSRTLLASAEESERAASERYRAGVGSSLDLLTAQSTLAAARAQEVQARADWLLSLAQLAHDTGALGPAPAAASTSPSSSSNSSGIPAPAAGRGQP